MYVLLFSLLLLVWSENGAIYLIITIAVGNSTNK